MRELIGEGDIKKEPEEAVVQIDSEEDEAEKVVKRRRRRKKNACDPHPKRPCVDCTKRCARIHGRAASSSPFLPSSSKALAIPAVPSFFKIMMGYFSEDMDIPPPFARTILDLAGSNIYLEDAFGLRWRVRLCLSDGVLSFGHGWKNFVLDHAVSCGEFLVFRQIARSVFTVQMFAPSAVERLFLCERNKRQSRKRKPRQKTSCPSSQTVKIRKNSVENCKNKKKRQRTDHRNDLGPKDCRMPDHVCIDDSDVPDSASELKCSETLERVLGLGATESQKISEVPTAHQCQAQGVLDAEAGLADDPTISEEKQSEFNARVTEDHAYNATEMEHDEGLNLPTNADALEPLAMVGLNEGSIDDIFLSADIYEFESDVCNAEAFSVDLNMEGPISTGQNSGFSCLEDYSQSRPSMRIGQFLVMPETLSCTENKEMTDSLETGTTYACVSAHDIDINVLPANEPSSFGEENSSPPTDVELHSSECALEGCDKDTDNSLLPCDANQAAQIEEDSSMKQDNPQDGQGNNQDSSGQHSGENKSSSTKLQEFPHPLQTGHTKFSSCISAQLTGNDPEGIHSGTSESGGVLALAASSSKFCITVPAPCQTWLELPSRLPVIPRTKKQGRKVVILKDPLMRLWPVLYQCTPRFSGFITGWIDICRGNNLQEGDTCEFELSGNSELSFKVVVPSRQ